MAIARSTVTSQGQITIPAAVRRKLGIGPGSVLEWEQVGQDVRIRRSGRFTLEDSRRAIFPEGKPPRKTLRELKEGIAQHMRDRYARS